jgi:hypothetical protein
MATKRKVRTSPAVQALTRLELELDRIATALERLALIAVQSTHYYGDDASERYVRVLTTPDNY